MYFQGYALTSISRSSHRSFEYFGSYATNLQRYIKPLPGKLGRGFFHFNTITPMTDELLAALRCPLDPSRETPLTRDEQTLRCAQCSVTFPIKQGIPVLVPDAATFPEAIKEASQLRCRRKENRRINATP